MRQKTSKLHITSNLFAVIIGLNMNSHTLSVNYVDFIIDK